MKNEEKSMEQRSNASIGVLTMGKSVHLDDGREQVMIWCGDLETVEKVRGLLDIALDLADKSLEP